MQKKVSIIFLLIFSLLLTGTACENKKDTDQTKETEVSVSLVENENDQEFTLVLYDNSIDYSASTLTSDSAKTKANNARARYTEELLKEVGINIKVDLYTKYGNQQPFWDYIKLRIQNGENVLFPIGEWDNVSEIKEMEGNGLIVDISDLILQNAPVFYKNTFLDKNFKYNLSDHNCFGNYYSDFLYGNNGTYAVPLGKNDLFKQTIVLVKKEIAEAYGKDIKIENLDDYEKLLEWIAENYKQYKPGLCPVETRTNNNINIYTILGDFMDCTYLQDTISSLMYESLYYCDMDPDLSKISMNSNIDIQPLVLHPAFKDTIRQIVKLKEDKLLYFYSTQLNLNVNEYATIISNTYNYSMNGYELLADGAATISDVSGYDAYLIAESGRSIHSGPITSHEIYGGHFLFSGDEKGVASMLYFVEWLYSRQENYDLFMYGKKDVDYEIKDDRISLLKNNEMIYGNMMPYTVLYNYNYERKLAFYPANWDALKEESSKISQTPTLYNYVIQDEKYKTIGRYESEMDPDLWNYISSYIMISDYMFLKNLFISAESNPEKVIDDYITNTIENQIINDLGKGYRDYVARLLSCLPE